MSIYLRILQQYTICINMNQKGLSLNNRNTTLDCFRLIASLCVVMFHSELLSNEMFGYEVPFNILLIPVILSKLFGVPVFLILSGYYFYTPSLQKTVIKAKRNIKKLLTIYIFAWIFFVTSANVYYYFFNKSAFMSEFILNIHYLPYLFFNHSNTDFSMIIGPIWYLFALIIVYAVFLSFAQLMINKYVFEILFTLSFLLSLYPGESIFGDTTFYLISRSFPIFCLGALLSKYRLKLSKIPLIFLVTISLSGFVLTYLIYYLTYDTNHYLAKCVLIFFSSSFFLILQKFPRLLINTKIPDYAKKYSLNIYLIHHFVLLIITFLITHNIIIVFLLGFTSSLVISVLYHKIKSIIISRLT